MEYKIIYANEKNIESLCKAVATVASERRYLATIEGFPIESVRNFVSLILENNLAQFYCVVGDEVVGWCDIIPKNIEGMKHIGILGMGLLKEYRGKGIGQQLLEKAIEHAALHNGVEKVELEVYASNEAAINLYKKMGFEIEGLRVMARKLDGYYDDIMLMGKLLRQ